MAMRIKDGRRKITCQKTAKRVLLMCGPENSESRGLFMESPCYLVSSR